MPPTDHFIQSTTQPDGLPLAPPIGTKGQSASTTAGREAPVANGSTAPAVDDICLGCGAPPVRDGLCGACIRGRDESGRAEVLAFSMADTSKPADDTTEQEVFERVEAITAPKADQGTCTVNGCQRAVVFVAEGLCAQCGASAKDAVVKAQLEAAAEAERLADDLEQAKRERAKARQQATRDRNRDRALSDPDAYPHDGQDTFDKVIASQGVELRFNERATEPEMRCADGDWEKVDVRKNDALRERIASDYTVVSSDGQKRPLRWINPRWNTHANAHLDSKRVDPFLEYLNELPKWDGKRRLETLFMELLGAEDDPAGLNRWASRQPWSAAAIRAIRPGEPVHEVVVLLGGQGIGKSTFFACMVPAEYRHKWYASQFAFLNDTKKMVEATAGKVIVEAGEMAGSTRAEREHIKGYVSSPADNVTRMAYGHFTAEIPRRFVLVGTSNDRACLPNDGLNGNRRFVPVEVPGRIRVEEMAAILDTHRSQIWAEALADVREGKKHWLYSDQLKKAQSERAEAHRYSDAVIEDRIRDELTHRDMSIGEIAAALGFGGNGPVSMQDQKRIGRALDVCNWRKIRPLVDGKRATIWRKFPTG